MNTDRFKNYEPDVRQLVLAFEREGGRSFFDVEELEIIADYYLEVCDVEGLEAAVKLGDRLFPHNGSIRLRKAQLLGIKGFYGKALRLLKQLEHDEPDNTDVCYALGTLYSMTAHAQKSIDYYLRTAVDGYDLGLVYGNVADEYVKLGKTAQAVHYYRKAVEYDSEEERSLYALWIIWNGQGRDERAIHYFERHVGSHPFCRAGWYCLGCAYLWGEPRRVTEAIEAFEYALAIDGRYESASYALAEAYLEKGSLERAVQTLRDVLDNTTDRARALCSLGEAYMRASCYHTAYSFLRDAVKENADSSFIWSELGRCCERLGYAEEAAGHYERAINLAPDFDGHWLDLAHLYMGQNRFAEAAALLESARQEADNKFLFDVRLMYCYYRLGLRNRLFGLLAEDSLIYAPQLRTLLSDYPDMAQDAQIVAAIKEIKN